MKPVDKELRRCGGRVRPSAGMTRDPMGGQASLMSYGVGCWFCTIGNAELISGSTRRCSAAERGEKRIVSVFFLLLNYPTDTCDEKLKILLHGPDIGACDMG